MHDKVLVCLLVYFFFILDLIFRGKFKYPSAHELLLLFFFLQDGM